MSFGAGHMQDMNNRLKQNRAQRPSQRKKFKENNREGIHSKEKASKATSLKTFTAQEIEMSKLQVRKKALAQRKKLQVFYAVSLVFTVLVFIALYLLLN
ncbi:hypothetical protein [Psychroflexus tropicus]|uniref:hypothetical protein n=1 Tax=Psychroflexus tropicus TaxID=197345 RepID=UPI000369B593|nr:hypothetical protein [Psychroflexus tropicus]